MSLIDTNRLPYQTVYGKNIYYMIATNIGMTDGLANGAVRKLAHAETNDERLARLSKNFEDSSLLNEDDFITNNTDYVDNEVANDEGKIQLLTANLIGEGLKFATNME
ncbi:hypothetical protein TNCV_4296971 [Trichonephila clavipes]|nr:hypothetical protein TNCV_4296971 [Trichonephila clavipes]